MRHLLQGRAVLRALDAREAGLAAVLLRVLLRFLVGAVGRLARLARLRVGALLAGLLALLGLVLLVLIGLLRLIAHGRERTLSAMTALVRCIVDDVIAAPPAAPFQNVALCAAHFTASGLANMAPEIGTQDTWTLTDGGGEFVATLTGVWTENDRIMLGFLQGGQAVTMPLEAVQACG